MKVDRQVLAHRLGVKINSAERKIDAAIEGVAALLMELSAARSAGLGAEICQPTVEHLTAALGQLGTVRGSVVNGHKSLALAETFASVMPFTGDDGYKPPHGALDAVAPPVVASAAPIALVPRAA